MNFIQKHYPAIILCGLFILYGINNYIWLEMNQIPPFDAEGYHLLGGLNCLDIMVGSDSLNAVLKLMKTAAFNFYPPVFHVSMTVFIRLFGVSIIS